MRDDKSNEDDLLRRYLLGELTDEEVDRLERRLLEDDDLFETVEAVEDDLLAAYARGDLDPEERERVLRRLASSPGGRDRFALTQGLTRIAAEQLAPAAEPWLTDRPASPPVPPVSRRPSIQRWAPLAACLLVTIGGGGLLVREIVYRPTGEGQIAHNEPAPAPEPQETPVPASPPVENDPAPPAPVPPDPTVIPAPTPAPTPAPGPAPHQRRPLILDPDLPQLPFGGAPVVFELALSTVRGAAAEIQQFKIPQEAERVELKVDLGGDEHASYNVLLTDLTTNQDTWEKSGVPPQTLVDGRNALLLDVPAERFPSNGDYQLTVEGLTSDGQLQPAVTTEFEVVHTVG